MVALDPNPTPCGGEAPKEEAPLLDLEIGTPEDATASDCKGETKEKKSGLAAAFTKFFEQTDAEKEEADRVARWALRVYAATSLSINHTPSTTVRYLITDAKSAGILGCAVAVPGQSDETVRDRQRDWRR
jgi:hypothetical protein